MGIKKEDVLKALAELESPLAKASADDLDQPEGADMGAPGQKMSDAAKAKKGYAKKAEDEQEDFEMMEKKKAIDEDEDFGDEDEMEEKAKKSFADELPEEVETKIDVSEFLKSLVDHTAESIDGIAARVQKSQAAFEKQTGDLFSAVEDLQKSQAKIGIVLKAICERIGVIENQPARAKAETVAKSQGAAERTFANGLEEGNTDKVFKSLSENPALAKSQISGALCELVRKGEASDMDVINFESSAYLRPELVNKLKTVL